MSGCLKQEKVPGNGIFQTSDIEKAFSFRGLCPITLPGGIAPGPHQGAFWNWGHCPWTPPGGLLELGALPLDPTRGPSGAGGIAPGPHQGAFWSWGHCPWTPPGGLLELGALPLDPTRGPSGAGGIAPGPHWGASRLGALPLDPTRGPSGAGGIAPGPHLGVFWCCGHCPWTPPGGLLVLWALPLDPTWGPSGAGGLSSAPPLPLPLLISVYWNQQSFFDQWMLLIICSSCYLPSCSLMISEDSGLGKQFLHCHACVKRVFACLILLLLLFFINTSNTEFWPSLPLIVVCVFYFL